MTKGWVSNVVNFNVAGGSTSIPIQYEAFDFNCSHCGNHLQTTQTCGQTRGGSGSRMPSPSTVGHLHIWHAGPSRSPPCNWQILQAQTTRLGRGSPESHGEYRPCRRRGPRRPRLHQRRNWPLSPDADGFIPVINTRRRPTLFDVNLVMAYQNPSIRRLSPRLRRQRQTEFR